MEPHITTMDDHRKSAPSSPAPSFVSAPKNIPPPVRELRRPPERSQMMMPATFIVVLLLLIANVVTIILVTRRIEALAGEGKAANQNLQTAIASVSGRLDVADRRDQDFVTRIAGFQQGLFDAGSEMESMGANLIRQGEELIAIGTALNNEKGTELIQKGETLKTEGVQYQELGARYKANSKTGL